MYPGPMNEKFQQDMKAINVEVTLVPLEWNNILSVYDDGCPFRRQKRYVTLDFP